MARRASLLAITRDLVSRPTASFCEHEIIDYLRTFADARDLACAEDVYGNVYITYQKGRPRRPLVLGAHIDHPGFVVTNVAGRRLDLEFRGGLSADYGRGELVRIYGDGSARARITSIRVAPGGRRLNRRIAGARAMLLRAGMDVMPGDLALWDVPLCTVRGAMVHARQCDDLVGAVSVLGALDQAAKDHPPGHLIGLFTRAEEVGLVGAGAVGRDQLLPEEAIVIAVETSSMASGRAEQGGGPIIRVGDRQHIFSPQVSQWMTAVAQEMEGDVRGFHYQRKLMDGGTTEATAYALYGYETGAACLALGNYHNAGPRNRVRAETIHLGDLDGLVLLFGRMLAAVPRYEDVLPALRKRYERGTGAALAELRRTRGPIG